MKILKKRWVKILLVAAFLLSVNATAFFGVLTVFGEETGCQQEDTDQEYRNAGTFMRAMGMQTKELVHLLCFWGQSREEELNRQISVQEFDLAEEEGEASSLKSIPVKDTTMTWKEYLEEQGMDFSAGYFLNGDEYWKGALTTSENAEEEILCEFNELSTESTFIRLKTEDFLSLFETYPGKWLWRRPSAEGTEESPDGERETYDSAETEGVEYNEELEDTVNVDLNEFSEKSQMYTEGGDYLIYDKVGGIISGNRMQTLSISKLKEARYVYFSLRDETEKKPEQWMDDIVRGFTTSLVRQEALEVYRQWPELWDQEWMNSGYIDAVRIFYKGSPFITYGEAREDSLHMTFVEEEVKAVFGDFSPLFQSDYQISLYCDGDIAESAWYAVSAYVYSNYQRFGAAAPTVTILGVFLSLVFGVLLLIAFLPPLWQRTEGKGRDKCPLEIWLLLLSAYAVLAEGLIYACFVGLPEYGAVSYLLRNYSVGGTLFGAAVLVELLIGTGLVAIYLLVSTLLYRWRNHCFLRGFLIIRIILWIAHKIRYGIARKIKYVVKKVLQNFGILKRRILFLAVIWVFSFPLMLLVCAYAGSYNDFLGVFVMFCYFVFMAGFSVMHIKDALDNRRLLEGCNRMQDGALGEKINTTRLYFDKLELAEAINSMGDGLEKAVQTSMKDERMKAELITNVSHDIKTPLTSIINYVDLLKREGITPEEQKEYLEVLDMKSQRLKQLIEDLVEVSKTSTGNVELQMTPLDFIELMNQALGEFQEKFEERKLELVVTCAEHKIQIWADGRRCYRILENLFQNVYKYAMPGTRVYVELRQEEKELLFTIKNISEAPLNIPVEELMERFVRGDAARSTGGSGLGLSIAQNLVTLQKGTFQIMLDGDLFKAEIRFPVLTSEASPEH